MTYFLTRLFVLFLLALECTIFLYFHNQTEIHIQFSKATNCVCIHLLDVACHMLLVAWL